MYRVGGEGVEGAGFEFKGLTLAATWRPLEAVRADLRARLQDHVLRIPSLSDRRDEIPDLCRALVREIKTAHLAWLASLVGSDQEVATPKTEAPPAGFDSERLRGEAASLESYVLSEDVLLKLQHADWRSAGELRGLGQVVRRVMRGLPIDVALSGAAQPRVESPPTQLGDALLFALLDHPGFTGHRGISTALRTLEVEGRRQFVERVRSDPSLRALVAEKLKLPADKVTAALVELNRSGRNGKKPM